MSKNYIAAGMIALSAAAIYYVSKMPDPSKPNQTKTNIESIAQESYSQPLRLADIREPNTSYENIQYINDVRQVRPNNNQLVYLTQNSPSLNPANGIEELPTPNTYSLNPTVQGESSVLTNPQTVYSNPPTSFEVPQNQVYREQQVIYYDRPVAKAVGRTLRGVGIGLRAIFRRIFCGRRNIETILVPTNEPIYYQNQ